MLSDLRYALRQLIGNRGFTVVALLTLALGIGINTTTFTLVNAILFRMPPYRDPGRLAIIFGTMPQSQFTKLAPANARDIVQQAEGFAGLTPWCWDFSNYAKPGEPAYRALGVQASGNFFSTLGIAPAMGRVFTPEDDHPGHNDVVVASERFWREKLGGDPNVVGSQIRLNGKSVTVIGVVSDRYQDVIYFQNVDLWQPLGYGEDNWSIRDNDWLEFVARLKPGVSLEQARAQLATVAARMAHDHPDTNSHRGLNIASYESSHSRGSAQILWTIMGLMLFVLGIACVNLANLQLVRTMSRMREYAIRIALGASRGQLIRQLLAESVLLSLAGGALGLLVAIWGNRLLGSRLQANTGGINLDLPLDYRVLGFTLVASLATGLLFGLMPGWIASRAEVGAAVKQGGRGTVGDRSKHRARRALVVTELALALASLAGAAYFVRGLQRITHADKGWESASRVTGSFMLPTSKYATDDQTRAGVERIRTELAALPGVVRVAVSGQIPIAGTFSHQGNFLIEGQQRPAPGQEPLALAERVTPGYFSTLGMHLVGGRDFEEGDRADGRQVVIINQAMARQFWPKGDAIGHRIGSTDARKPDWREIVGIVNDLPSTYGPALTPFQTYRPFAQDPDHWLTFTLFCKGAPSGLADDARRAIARADSDLAVYQLGTVDSILDQVGSGFTLVEQLLAIAALLGLLLAVVGIYGVIANLAVQRTQEIGVRMALGARPGSVLWLILKDGVRLAAFGTGIGLVLALLLTRGLSLALPTIPGQDIPVILGLAAVLVASSLVACCLPALRATHVNPVDALRAE
jgi:predicted permease